tara:strand:- start:361 stop:495 length:135 start_codon:yes stop_codon:yes gene_type:complete
VFAVTIKQTKAAKIFLGVMAGNSLPPENFYVGQDAFSGGLFGAK